ncbi:unnamed protein product [Peronospora belbahrii]|uniref:Uncharacterized protein n=1 Tax=Peronospora belbahrii TaxID=622444 RepID=A0AAU9KNV8_9STRA|nr:unnamed protein product [Peronospora belbahrii]
MGTTLEDLAKAPDTQSLIGEVGKLAVVGNLVVAGKLVVVVPEEFNGETASNKRQTAAVMKHIAALMGNFGAGMMAIAAEVSDKQAVLALACT